MSRSRSRGKVSDAAAARRAEYCRYIQSPRWKRLRKQILRRDPFCVQCGELRSHHVHHLTYERFQNELPEDLVGLCEICHRLIHDQKVVFSALPKRLRRKPKPSRHAVRQANRQRQWRKENAPGHQRLKETTRWDFRERLLQNMGTP